MTKTEIWLLVGAVGTAAAAWIYWRKSAPSTTAAASPGAAPALSVLSLPNPNTLEIGTQSPDGRYHVESTKQGTHYWQGGPSTYGSALATVLSGAGSLVNGS